MSIPTIYVVVNETRGKVVYIVREEYMADLFIQVSGTTYPDCIFSFKEIRVGQDAVEDLSVAFDTFVYQKQS